MRSTLVNTTSSGIPMELRKRRRFTLSAPAFFCWQRPDGNLQQGEGTTRDIGGRGVFVVCASNPPVNGGIEIDIYLPAVGATGRSIHLYGQGTIIRCEQLDGHDCGFAADVDFEANSSENSNGLEHGRKPQ